MEGRTLAKDDAPDPSSLDAPRGGGSQGSARAKGSRTIGWVSSTYFAEGMPYMIVRILSGIYFTDVGAKERYIGYLNFLGVPWNLKFLWAPFVDALGTKRRWLVLAQFLISISTALIGAICFSVPSAGDPTPYLIAIAAIFIGMAFVSATNDVAIDAYYLEGLTDPKDQAAYSGFRVMAYRVAMIFVRSGLVALAEWAGWIVGTENRHAPWAYAFGAGAVTMFALALLHGWKLPHFEPARGNLGEKATARPRDVLRSYGRAFTTYLRQDKVVLVLCFIVVYKLGDDVMFSMVTPFLMRELSITKAQYSWIGGFVGAGGAIAGAMLGGWWIEKVGLRRAIWPLTILMNVNIGAYVWLAWAKPDPTTVAGISTIAFIHGYEQVAAGLGNAALLVYLLRTCQREFKAAHYAIGSAIMSLGSTVVGGFGGWIVESVGYLYLFVLALVLSLPSMILLFWVPIREQEVL